MARVCGGRTLALIIVLTLSGAVDPAASADSVAEAAGSGLYDRPVLVVDPGVHTRIIGRLSADQEGRFLVSASDDKTVRVWSAEDGKALRTIRLPAGPENVGMAFAAAMSPDGALVAAGGWTADNEIYLFDWASGRLVRRVGGFPNVVLDLAFSPDGQRLAVTLGGAAGVRLIDPGSGQLLAADEAYGDDSNDVSFDAAGRLATASGDGKVRLYDPGLRLLRASPAPREGRPFGISFSPDSRRLAIGYEDVPGVDVLDATTLERLFAADFAEGGKFDSLGSVAWSADGTTLNAGGFLVKGDKYILRRWHGSGQSAPVDIPLSRTTVMDLHPLPNGRLAFASADPRLGVLDHDGREVWAVESDIADFQDQEDILALSADGSRVRFGYERDGGAEVVFSVPELRPLPGGLAEDLATARTEAPGLVIEGWTGYEPSLNGQRLVLNRGEAARGLAIAPDGQRFALGADWYLRVFGRTGMQLWQQAAPGVTWAVNISSDGRFVVAAYADGTIRWYDIDEGTELLSFMPLADRTNWVAWTPDGFYAATPGAHGVLRWHVNRGRDEAPEQIPVSDIPQLRRPAVLPLVLREMDIVRALGLAELAEAREAVQVRTKSRVAPGAQLHVLAVGVSEYNAERAAHLRLRFAARDAWDVASALLNTQTSLYADVKPQVLRDDEASRAGVLDALDTMRRGMAVGAGRDLAVVHFSGHGAVVDGKLFLLPYDVDTRTLARIRSSALSAEELRDELVELGKLGRVLVLLDACHSGAVTADGTGLAADAALLRATLTAHNVTVLTSSSGREVSREDPAWGHGAFTLALLEALGSVADTDHDGLIGVAELVTHLTRRVPALTNHAQTPGVEVRYESGLFAAGL